MNLGDVLARVGPRARPESDHGRQERAQARKLERATANLGAAGQGAVILSLKSGQRDEPACGPESRTIPRTPGPGALAIAAIVS